LRSSPLVDKASVSAVRRHLQADLQASGAEPQVAFDCLVAITEACTNAFMHGHTQDGDSEPPVIEWEVTTERLTCVVRDFSNHGWERTLYPSVPVDEDTVAPESRIGGLGLTLMAELMDYVDIDKTGAGTTVTITKALTDGARLRIG
jgi:serine/threonine-protein kinase RsbW